MTSDGIGRCDQWTRHALQGWTGMGIDLIDLEHRVEREFGIEIDRHSLSDYMIPILHPTGRIDFAVREYVEWVEHELENHGLCIEPDAIYSRLRPHIIDVLKLDEDELTLDAWMFRDLGCS